MGGLRATAEKSSAAIHFVHFQAISGFFYQ
jgi:hypothetical protein